MKTLKDFFDTYFTKEHFDPDNKDHMCENRLISGMYLISLITDAWNFGRKAGIEESINACKMAIDVNYRLFTNKDDVRLMDCGILTAIDEIKAILETQNE